MVKRCASLRRLSRKSSSLSLFWRLKKPTNTARTLGFGDFLELGWNKFGYVGVPWNYFYQSNQGTLHRRHRRARSGANGGRHDRKATKWLYPDWSERGQGRQRVY